MQNLYDDYFIIRSCIQIDDLRYFDDPVRLLPPQLDIYGINLIIIMDSHFFLPFFSG